MKPYTYFIIDLACLSIPFLSSFYSKYKFYKEWKAFGLANLLVAIPFLIWDAVFTAKGVWGFNPDYLIGVYLFNLPLEEILFFICVPYACIFSYFALSKWVKIYISNKFSQRITLILSLGSGALVVLYHDRLYTVTTFLVLTLVLAFCYRIKRNLIYIYSSYLLILPFFFIINGLLTGFGLEYPIVWYNNAENMGIRLGTIPLEDVFYGFLLVSLTILLFDHISHIIRSKPKDKPTYYS